MTTNRSITLLLTIIGLLLLSACHHRNARVAPRSDRLVWRGMASWYGRDFHGRLTANGERYDMHALTAAHRTLPFGTLVEVKSRNNGSRVRVRINDRGPFVKGRIIDVSYAAARKLGMVRDGVVPVELRLLRRDGRVAAVSDPGEGCFSNQVGSFRRRANAEQLHRKIAELGPRVRIHRSSGQLWQVRVGCYPTRGEANSAALLLRRKGFDSFIVTTVAR